MIKNNCVKKYHPFGNLKILLERISLTMKVECGVVKFMGYLFKEVINIKINFYNIKR
jgi:hypothetical protein